MRPTVLILVVIGVLVPCAAWSQDASVQGQQLYAEQKCVMCRSIAAKGNRASLRCWTTRIDHVGPIGTGYGNRPYRANTGFFRILYVF